MEVNPAERAFREGMTLYANEYYGKALKKLQEAVQIESENPVYLSTLGLVTAQASDKYEIAEQLCSAALRRKHNEPQFYLNLAEVYRRAGRRDDALFTLRDGLKFTRQSPRLKEKLQQLGVRRPPVIPALGRDSGLNQVLGRVRHKLMGSASLPA